MDVMTLTSSPLHQALAEPSFAREAVIEAMILTAEAGSEDGGDADIETVLGWAFDDLGLAVEGTHGYALADALISERRTFTALEAGGDPLWYADDGFSGDVEDLRTNLITKARSNWRYMLDHIVLT